MFGDESRVELQILARPVRLPMLAAGAVDMVISMIPMTAENASQCEFSHPYFSSGLSLLLTGECAQSMTLEDLAGKTIAFRKQSFNNYGGELQRIADEHGIKLQLRYYPSFDEAAKAVRRARPSRWAATLSTSTLSGSHAGLHGERQVAGRASASPSLLERATPICSAWSTRPSTISSAPAS